MLGAMELSSLRRHSVKEVYAELDYRTRILHRPYYIDDPSATEPSGRLSNQFLHSAGRKCYSRATYDDADAREA